MTGVVSPNIQPMRDLFSVHELGKPDVLTQTNIALAGCKYKSCLFAIAAEVPLVMQIRQEVRWAVKIAIFVVVAIQELVNVEGPSHAYAVRHLIWMLQRK